MSASNIDIAKVFDEIADLLEIQNENAFRIRAYRNAARLIEGLGDSIAEMLAKQEDLTELPGIGKDLAQKIREIVETGTCAVLEEQRRKLPPTITTLLRIPGLGPKRVQALYRNLDVGTPEQLYAAVTEGKVRELPGFGEKTEATILQALSKQAVGEPRMLLATAAEHAERLRAYLAQTPGVKDAVIAGSYRRARETVGDIDIVVTARSPTVVMERFCSYEDVTDVKSKGDTRATVIIKDELQVDLRVVAQTSFGAALYYFTGSKTHNVAVRRIAQQHGLKINEYGVFRGKRRIAGDTELSVFKAVGLPYIPPELRENRGEIEAALAGTLPVLLESTDIKGDFGVRLPDDETTFARLIAEARARKLTYAAIVFPLAKLASSEAHRWIDRIDSWNDAHRDFTLFKAANVNIAESGGLKASAIDLAHFDIVGAGINDTFNLSRSKQTQRVLHAMEHARFTILLHPAGRQINQPAAYEVDVPQIVRAAKERGCLLEFDARPDRLDLPDAYCRLAKEEGVPVAMASNARDPNDLSRLAFAVTHVRRGWLEAEDVANTRSASDVRKMLAAIQR